MYGYYFIWQNFFNPFEPDHIGLNTIHLDSVGIKHTVSQLIGNEAIENKGGQTTLFETINFNVPYFLKIVIFAPRFC